ncbi:claspin-like [Anopheles maculipalpis]|uniref:claspin-like n=1 Tax=Anopheles maculipalpis TaxID=1496333 RepID=UPI00215918C9|nr:claspin-like [Anopheles maculipalpis]
MSGDTQPKKRKDKKRKKDDEDTVKETTVHAPKQPSAGAAQAAKEPGDIQMHIHSDHGTGGHWCAKIVFFILLAGLGALIGLILMESQGVSNDDTPLSESRYSEFFNGWVDETRQDDHHHDEILAAINSLDDHDDDGGEEHHAVDDHDDDGEGHDQDGDDDDHDDGAPYAEEEDHDDDEEGADVLDDDDEDEGLAQKLDDDEVEEIFTQQEAAAQQEAVAAAEDDDNDDDDEDEDGDGQDDEDDDDDAGANDKINVVDGNDDDDDDDDDDKNEETKDLQDNDDDNDEDDKKDNNPDDTDDNDDDDSQDADNDDDDDVLTNTKTEKNDENDNDDEEEDDDDDANVTAATEKDDEEDNDDDVGVDNERDDAEPAAKIYKAAAGKTNVDDGDDDDDDQDDTPFDEEQSNALNDSSNQSLPMLENSFTDNGILKPSAQSSRDSEIDDPDTLTQPSPSTPSNDEAVTGDTLKDQMDDLVRNFNKLAESLNVPKVEEAPVEIPETVSVQDAYDDGDEAEIEELTRGSQPANEDDNDDDDDDNVVDADDDDKEAFVEFVDNDGGEEEYLEKVRAEQQRRAAAEEERRAAVEPEEESSLTVKIFVGVALLGAAHLLLTSPRAPTTKKPTNQIDDKQKLDSVAVINESSPLNRTTEQNKVVSVQPAATKTVMDDFVYAGPTDQLSSDKKQVIEGNVIIFDNNDDAERYSGDEYEYELEEMEEGDEEAELEMEDEAEKQLIQQEQAVGSFVPITFEDFNSMYRSPVEIDAEVAAESQQEAATIQPTLIERSSSKKGTKDSLLARKKPPKGAFNKLIYGLHKDPIVIPTNEMDPLSSIRAHDPVPSVEKSENVSAKVEAKSVLTALLSEIPSPPIERDHAFVTLVPTGSSAVRSTSPVDQSSGSAPVQQPVKTKHVEFLLPEQEEPEYEPESESELERTSPLPVGDHGSKENLFIPQDTSEEELEPNEYAEECDGEYAEEEDEIVYEEEEEEVIDDIESVLLNQYGSDEEEEPLTDDNIPPAGDEEEASDVDDSDLMRRLEEKYGKLPATEATVTSEGNDDDEEATPAGWTKIPSRAEEADRSYQEELRRAEQQLDENKPQEALAIFDRIILRKPKSIVALVGRARCLDALAEQKRSNAILTEAIAAYRKVIEQELAVDDATLKMVSERCIDRMRFQGQHAKAIEVHKVLVRRFDNEPQYRNQLAVSYLYMNRLAEAKAVLHETLLRWIDDGFALVHYGFVLKTLDQNMELAAQYLQEGIATDQPGTQDGRFYFQLGDALQRLGRNSEALDVYRKGVKKKLFLSLYQRSLYNVDGLRSRPFWTEEQTTYATELELIRAQWQQVRDEGLKLLNSAGVFVNESENLRDRGDWKQLELFSRGTRIERNCGRAPLTCRLVEQYFPAARTCKRGQVKFSVMHPGTHVWPHCGPTNCRIRAHLGLSVPQGTYIRVAEETRSWEDGKWLIFDDSFEHEVWHNGTETRLVLIVDFWHPELTESQRRTLSPI